MFAQHERNLTDESPPTALIVKVTAKGKGIRREAESEGNRWQTYGVTDGALSMKADYLPYGGLISGSGLNVTEND